MEGSQGRVFLVPRGMAANRSSHATCREGGSTGEESRDRLLRAGERDNAPRDDLRSDQPHRGRCWLRPFQEATGKTPGAFIGTINSTVVVIRRYPASLPVTHHARRREHLCQPEACSAFLVECLTDDWQIPARIYASTQAGWRPNPILELPAQIRYLTGWSPDLVQPQPVVSPSRGFAARRSLQPFGQPGWHVRHKR